MSDAVIPPLVELHRMPGERAFRLRWADDYEAVVPWRTVRGWCPCAECQGHAADIRFRPVGPVEPQTIEPVGRYAVSIAWSDGHATGIYRFDFLREIAVEGEPAGSKPS